MEKKPRETPSEELSRVARYLYAAADVVGDPAFYSSVVEMYPLVLHVLTVDGPLGEVLERRGLLKNTPPKAAGPEPPPPC